jgi:DNA processing protein
MARGIDTVAHRTALDSGGRTIAVLGSGLDVVYPPENRSLMEEIVGRGAVVSEFPMGTTPLAGNFPTRNRVISGLSLGVVAVEAGQKSGVFSTVRWAAEQGRDVFAVPGNASSGLSVGTNTLIRHGAKLTTDAADILEELNLEPLPQRSKQTPLLSREEAAVFETLDSVPLHVDSVCQKVNLPISRTLSVLLSLEMRELISQLPGKLFVRKES